MSKDTASDKYRNCTANIPNSILRYFGAETRGDTLPVLDDYLEGQFRNVIVLVIGGMTEPVYCRNMDPEKPFRKHHLKLISPVFPSSDGTADNADKAAVQKLTPCKSIFGELNDAGIGTYDISPCADPETSGFQDILDTAKDLCGRPGQKLICAYWPYLNEILIRSGCSEQNGETRDYLEDIENRISLFMYNVKDTLLIITGDLPVMNDGGKECISGDGTITGDEALVPLIVFKDFFFLGTDVTPYVDEAFRRISKKYPWALKSMFDEHYEYVIEDVEGKKEFARYYTWDDKSSKRYAEGWDGELYIQRIIYDQESRIEYANEVKEVFDVRPDYGVDCHGWCLERFEFRSHVLGGYSAFVQAGDRCTGGSREFFFTPDMMSGTFGEFLDKNGELLSGAFGLDRDYMEKFEGLKEFLGFKE